VQTASGQPVPNMACHFFGSCTFLRILRASCFMTCFVNTPEERNLTPSFISSSSTFCPSSLMQVTFLSSITIELGKVSVGIEIAHALAVALGMRLSELVREAE
jgi:hypothetical protein